MLNIFSTSVRMRMVALTSFILFLASVFLAIFFPARLGEVLQRRMEERTVSLAELSASAIAPGIEFDDKTNTQESLEGFRQVADFEYAVVRRANGTVLASINLDRAPGELVAAGEQPVLSIHHGSLRLDRKVRGKGGVTGTLTVGFSMSGLQKETRTQTQFIILVSLLVFLFGSGGKFFHRNDPG